MGIRRRLIAGAVLALALWAALPLPSDGASPRSRLNDIQKRIRTTEGSIGRRKGTERVLTTQISAYTARINALQARITVLERRQAAVQADLDRKQAELGRLQDALRSERRRLVRLRARLAEARAALGKRLIELYQADRPDIVTVVLDAHGFADLLETGEFMERVSEQDQRIIELVRAAKAEATATAARLQVLERRQRRVTAIVLAHRDEIAGVRQQLVGARAGLDATRAGKRRVLTGVRSERHQLEGALSELKAEQAKIQATLQRAARVLPARALPGGSGGMIWPRHRPITPGFCGARAWGRC